MSNANEDLTDRRIRTMTRAVTDELCKVYERMKDHKPGFWCLWVQEEQAMMKKLEKRPLPLADIELAISMFRRKMLGAM
jgi:hypothetical protein